MRTRVVRALALAFALSVGAWGCGDDEKIRPGDDAGTASDAGVGGALERPPVLPRPPSGGLPADLRPPR